MRGRLLVIDGYSLLHRAYYALPLLTTADGRPTNGIYGFLTMFLRLVNERHPDYVAVAFDRGPSFRHEMYGEYKLGRQKTPPELRSQIPLLEEVLGRMHVPVVGVEGYEGDDILGTLARWGEEQGLDVLLVTGDRDALQLVSSGTRVLLTKRGITEVVEYDPEAVRKEYGVSPERLPDFKALTGDSSDNLPGVRGIGPKTARELLAGGASLESLLTNSSAGRWSEILRKERKAAELFKNLATIRRDVPLTLSPDALRYGPPPVEELRPLFQELEFKSLLRTLGEGGAAADRGPTPADIGEILTGPGTLGIGYRLRDGGLRVLALSREGRAAETETDIERWLALAAADSGPRAVFDWKPLLRTLAGLGKSLSIEFDVALAGYLLNPESSRNLTDLARRFLARDVEPRGAAGEASLAADLMEPLREALTATGMLHLFETVEMPLVEVLAEMEEHGLGLDTAWLREMGRELADGIARVSERIYDLAGGPFNLNSPIQLREILFERLGLPILKRTKTGPSTDAEVLENLADRHEIVALILEHRQLAKLKSTYVDGLLAQVDGGDRIRTTFNQMVTATGRLSSTEPNLQNIPVRMELGRRLRRAFRPVNPENRLLAADYSQIELRILAHLSGDPGLIASFRADEDIHRRTAAEVFGLRSEEVTPELRARAKAVNFGIVYGISDFGLARDVGLSREEAAEFIQHYFERYPRVREYLERVVAEGREKGYVTTIFGRRRYLPDLNHRNRAARSLAERMAMNTPIQGTAADIIKVAMVRTHRRLRELDLQSRLVLQVHDELILETPPGEVPRLAELLHETMEGAAELLVPLRIDIKVGGNWYDLAPWSGENA